MVTSSSPRKRILLFTSTEYGQASVVIATAYELIVRGCEVHISSFEISTPHPSRPDLIANPGGYQLGIRKRVSELNNGVYGTIPNNSVPAIFHPIDCLSMVESMCLNGQKAEETSLHGVGFSEAWRMLPWLTGAVVPWGPDEYMRSYADCISIIEDVNPDAVVCEKLIPQAYDACMKLGKKIIVILPNGLEIVGAVQPYLTGIWRTGVVGAGWPYPLPWYLIPANLILFIRMVTLMFGDPRVTSVSAARKAAGIPGIYPTFVPCGSDNEYILPGVTELDFDFSYMPPNVTTCGPMLIPGKPLSELDPDLLSWMAKKPTVLINFGSHIQGMLEYDRAIALSIRHLITERPDIQVLWKHKTQKGSTADPQLAEIIAPVSSSVKEVAWIKAELVALLRSGHIVANMHHGGSNSFYECAEAGIPQVVIPCWFDTYENVRRVEFRGIGVWGSKKCGMKLDGMEVGRALVKAVNDVVIVKEAKRVGELVRTKYGGRKQAADRILELVGNGWCASGSKDMEK